MKKQKVDVLDAIKAHETTKNMTDEEMIAYAKKKKGAARIDSARLVRAMRNKRKKAE
ncbi:MAG: hypothetical protein HOH43_24725 [Candidatus Latescibacteria bacterium]|nr:hypothetical protein [Candidatus Latescibacterota bacterium]